MIIFNVMMGRLTPALGFPILIIAMIPLRVKVLPKIFTPEELDVMDDMTANNGAVLASLGGAPTLRKAGVAGDTGLERRYSEAKHGVPRQRAGSIHR